MTGYLPLITALAGGGHAKTESKRESEFAHWGPRDSQKEEAYFHRPVDLMVDDEGRGLLADSGNRILQAVSLEH